MSVQDLMGRRFFGGGRQQACMPGPAAAGHSHTQITSLYHHRDSLWITVIQLFRGRQAKPVFFPAAELRLPVIPVMTALRRAWKKFRPARRQHGLQEHHFF